MVAGDEIFKSSMLAVPEDSPVKETERNSARESKLSLDDKEDLAVARVVFYSPCRVTFVHCLPGLGELSRLSCKTEATQSRLSWWEAMRNLL